MAKVSTETLRLDGSTRSELNFKYDINVDKEGVFSTTLPKDIVLLFQSENIDLRANRMKNLGYLSDSTMDGLKRQVKSIGLEYLSREMIIEKIVIHYIIQTQCSYAIGEDGNICPNPSKEWTGIPYYMESGAENFPNHKWHDGNVRIDACNPTAFGFQIYAAPFVKRVFKYKSGKEKTEFSRMCYGGEIAKKALEGGYFLRWLNDVPCIAPTKDLGIKEIDYSEIVAEFFVNLIKSICSTNERIKDFLEPDMILKIAESRTKLLGG